MQTIAQAAAGMTDDEKKRALNRMDQKEPTVAVPKISYCFPEETGLHPVNINSHYVPQINSSMSLRNCAASYSGNNDPETDYNKLNFGRWIVEDVITVLDMIPGNTKEAMLYDPVYRIEVYLKQDKRYDGTQNVQECD